VSDAIAGACTGEPAEPHASPHNTAPAPSAIPNGQVPRISLL
jgi:hypothetical protein